MPEDFEFDTGFFDYCEQNEYQDEPHPTDVLHQELEAEDYDIE